MGRGRGKENRVAGARIATRHIILAKLRQQSVAKSTNLIG